MCISVEQNFLRYVYFFKYTHLAYEKIFIWVAGKIAKWSYSRIPKYLKIYLSSFLRILFFL